MASPAPSQRVYMTGLPAGMDQAKLLSIFGAYGTIEESALLQNGAAIIKFATLDEATWFVNNLNGNMPEGLSIPLNVQFAKPRGSAISTSTALGGKAGLSSTIGSFKMPMTQIPLGQMALSQMPMNLGISNSRMPQMSLTSTNGLGSKSGGKGDNIKSAASTSSIQLLKAGLQSSGTLSPSQAGMGQRSEAQQLCISGLPPDTTDKDLYDLFGPFGAIPMKGVKAMLGPGGRCTGIGFVDFLDAACVANAVQALNGTVLPDGTQLHLNQKSAAVG